MDSAWSTPGSNAATRFAMGWPLMAKVLLVEPVTAGQAPVASEYQPAPVFGGAWVSRPLPAAEDPFLRNEAMVRTPPAAAYLATRSWRSPSATKKTALSVGGDGSWPPPPWPEWAPTAEVGMTIARIAMDTRAARPRRCVAARPGTTGIDRSSVQGAGLSPGGRRPTRMVRSIVVGPITGPLTRR